MGDLTFKELFKKIGLNQKEVAKLLEKSQKQVSNYINEVTKPDNYIMERMLNIAKHKALIKKPEGVDFKELQQELKSFYGVNSLEAVAEKMGYTKASATNWRRNKALTAQAELEFIRAKNEKNMLEKNIFYPPNTPPMKQIEAEVIIPYYKDFSVSAGFGSLNFDGEIEMLPFNKNELRAMFGISNFNKMGIISVIGDSMHPTLKEGQMLLFQEDVSSIEGAIYIIEYQSELFVKRLKKRPLSLVSDNKEYSNIEIKELQELKIIGRVVGAYEIIYQRL